MKCYNRTTNAPYFPTHIYNSCRLHLDCQPFPYMVLSTLNHKWTMNMQNSWLNTLSDTHGPTLFQDTARSFWPSGATVRHDNHRFHTMWQIIAFYAIKLPCSGQNKRKILKNKVWFLWQSVSQSIHNLCQWKLWFTSSNELYTFVKLSETQYPTHNHILQPPYTCSPILQYSLVMINALYFCGL